MGHAPRDARATRSTRASTRRTTPRCARSSCRRTRPPSTAGARIVMASFSSTAAGKVHGDRHLITDVLKGELGLHGLRRVRLGGRRPGRSGDYPNAVAQAINAGIDMVMVPTDYERFIDAVKSLVLAAARSTQVADRRRRHAGSCGVKFEMGLFEHPMPPAGGRARRIRRRTARSRARPSPSRRSCSRRRRASCRSPSGKKVLLAGSGADDIGLQSGGWTISWQGSPGPTTPGTTIADDLAARLGDRLIDDGQRRDPRRAPRPTTGIVVVAERPYAEGVGDSATLALPARTISRRSRRCGRSSTTSSSSSCPAGR